MGSFYLGTYSLILTQLSVVKGYLADTDAVYNSAVTYLTFMTLKWFCGTRGADSTLSSFWRRSPVVLL